MKHAPACAMALLLTTFAAMPAVLGQGRVVVLERRTAEVEQRLSEAEKKLEGLEEAVSRGEAGELSEGLASLKSELESLRGSVDELTDADLRTRLDDLGESLETLQAELEDTTDSIWADLASRSQISGRTTSYYEKRQAQLPHFRGVKVALLVNSQVTQTIRFFGEIEFEDAAGASAGSVHVERGWMEFAFTEPVGLRIGITDVPFGRYNRWHEEWRHPINTRPLIHDFLFPGTYSDVGALLRGVPLRVDDFSLNYEIGLVNGLTAGFTPTVAQAGLQGGKPSFATDNNANKAVVGRIGGNVTEQVEFGVSGYYGNYTNEDVATPKALSILCLDLSLVFDQIVFRTELMGARLDTAMGYSPVPASAAASTTTGALSLPGGGLTVQDGGPIVLPPTVGGGPFPIPKWQYGAYGDLELRFFPDFLRGTPFGAFDRPWFFVAARGDYVAQIYDAAVVVDPESVKYGVVKEAPAATMISAAVGYRPVLRSSILVQYSKSFGDMAYLDDWLVRAAASLAF